MNRDEFLPKAGIFSECVFFVLFFNRTGSFITPDRFSDYLITVNGKQYRWSAGSPGSGGELPKVIVNDFDTGPCSFSSLY